MTTTTATAHLSSCRCDACAIPPSRDPLNRGQQQAWASYADRVDAAETAVAHAQGLYDAALGRRRTAHADAMRRNPSTYEPLGVIENADTMEQYHDAVALLERALGRRSDIVRQQQAAVHAAGVTLAANA